MILFKRNEIKLSFFDSLFPLLYVDTININKLKYKEYGNFEQLDNTKSKIDLLSKQTEINRRICVKYLHQHELIKVICKKKVISRAYFKLYEMIYYDPIVKQEQLNCFFICEAPGGFIECISDIRIKSNKKFDFISVSIKSDTIEYDKYINNDKYFYNDVTNDVESIINKVNSRFPDGLELITADGGFDVKYFNAQEICSSKLILCEIYLALSTQKKYGTFVIKIFDMFTHNSMIYYLILCSFYEYVKIIKPVTSRNSNSERYLLCSSFMGRNDIFLQKLKNIISKFKVTNKGNNLFEYTIIFPNYSFGNNIILKEYFTNRIRTLNNIIIQNQIKTIDESIQIALSTDIYFNNLIMKIFSENNYKNINTYFHIIKSRIKECIKFLKNHNINIHQIMYRFE